MLCYKLSDELATFAMIKYVSGDEELVGLHNCSRHVHFSNSLPDWQKSFLNFHLTIPTLICIGLCFFFLPDFGKSVVFHYPDTRKFKGKHFALQKFSDALQVCYSINATR